MDLRPFELLFLLLDLDLVLALSHWQVKLGVVLGRTRLIPEVNLVAFGLLSQTGVS